MSTLNLDAKTESDVRGGRPGSRPSSRPSQRAAAGGKPAGKPATDKTQITESELRTRLGGTFDKIADWLDARDDSELADIVREDGEAMSKGLVSLTKPFKQLRTILSFFLSFVEPLLAFGRVFRVLAGRLADRRVKRAEQRQPASEPQP
jgi:hypothetical protein